MSIRANCVQKEKFAPTQQKDEVVLVDLSGVHWGLLRQQKRILVQLLAGCVSPFTLRYHSMLQGIVHLLDHIQDEAAKSIGENHVFGTKMEKENMDRFQTEISIGGPVPRRHIEELIEVLNAEELQSDWGEPIVKIGDEKDLLAHKNDKGVLWFCDEERAWGIFEGLEEILVKAGIAFNRLHDSRYETDGELAMFRSGMEQPRCCLTDSSGRPVVSVKAIQEIRDSLRKDRSAASIKSAIRQMQALCKNSDVEPLAEFEIVD